MPSDISTLFQNNAGTNSVTTVGQVVGLMLDKSKGLAFGSELRATGIVSLAGTATAASYNATTGVGEVTRVDLSNQSFVSFAVAANKYFRITIQSTGISNIVIRDGNNAGAIVLSIPPGSPVTAFLVSTTGTFSVTSSTGTQTFVLSSIQESLGNHASQATTLSRPTLALQSNQFHLSGGSINWTAPAGTYTVAYLADTGPTILTSQSLSGATNVMAASKIFEYVAVNRALTAAETQGLLDYFNLKGRYL